MLTPILRTVIPALWGSMIGWFLTVVPVLEPLRADLLAYGELAVPFISAALIGAWYAVCHWLEPKFSPWFARIFLGSAKTPSYEQLGTVEYVTIDPTPTYPDNSHLLGDDSQ